MQTPLEVSFRNMDRSDAVEARVRESAAKLEQFYDRITSCRVLIEMTNRQHHKGNLFHVTVDMTVPGSHLVVNRNPEKKHEHEDVYVAVRDAFKAARRQLEDHVKRRSDKAKAH